MYVFNAEKKHLFAISKMAHANFSLYHQSQVRNWINRIVIHNVIHQCIIIYNLNNVNFTPVPIIHLIDSQLIHT